MSLCLSEENPAATPQLDRRCSRGLPGVGGAGLGAPKPLPAGQQLGVLCPGTSHAPRGVSVPCPRHSLQ